MILKKLTAKLLFITLATTVGLSSYSANINQEINQSLRSNKVYKQQKPNLGLLIASSEGQAIYSKEAYQPLPPASLMKLFTATAALSYLGPNYRFSTTLLTQGSIKDDTFKGNIFFKFSGDPSLKKKDLSNLIKTLQDKGIKTIKGSVYIDNTAYNQSNYPAGLVADNLNFKFAAPVNAFILNENTFILKIFTKDTKSNKARLQQNLPAQTATFANNTRIVKRHLKNCPFTIQSDCSNHYQISGCLTPNQHAHIRMLPVRNIKPYAIASVQHILKEQGITLTGKVAFKKTPRSAKSIKVHYSKPLLDITTVMLKKSDNLYANSILKKIGQIYYKKPGTWANGISAMKSILEPSGIDFFQYGNQGRCWHIKLQQS